MLCGLRQRKIDLLGTIRRAIVGLDHPGHLVWLTQAGDLGRTTLCDQRRFFGAASPAQVFGRVPTAGSQREYYGPATRPARPPLYGSYACCIWSRTPELKNARGEQPSSA